MGYLWEKTKTQTRLFLCPFVRCDRLWPWHCCHLQRDVSRGHLHGVSSIHGWSTGYHSLGGSWEAPVGRRSSRCGLSPCVTSPAPSSLLGCNCVPRSAGLGWEDISAQLLCLTWGFSSLPHLHSREGVVPVPPMSWSDSAPQTSAVGFPAGIPSLDGAVSPSAQAISLK